MGVMTSTTSWRSCLLGKWAFACWPTTRRAGTVAFIAADSAHLPGVLDTDIWTTTNPTLTRNKREGAERWATVSLAPCRSHASSTGNCRLRQSSTRG
jgi:hypothetical protein